MARAVLFRSSAIAWAMAAVTSAAVIACGGAAADDGTTAEARVAIQGGTIDTRHAAVGAVLGPHGGCTATVISVTSGIGTALTAAHCIGARPDVFIEGDDIDMPDAVRYPIVDVIVHPAYGGGLNDFALVRFSGASEGSPTIPVMSPADDDLEPGAPLEFVGFGSPMGQVPTSHPRRSVRGVVSELDADLVEYSQTSGGPCRGDSGGPAIADQADGERVAAVTSYGDAMCASYGVSGRVSAAYDGFVLPTLERRPVHETCVACRLAAEGESGVCSDERARCDADVACSRLSSCITQCGDDARCRARCEGQFPSGLDTYMPLEQCSCARGCPRECGDSPICPKPACGIHSEWLSCQACLEDQCCGAAVRRDLHFGEDELSSCLAERCDRECRGTDLLPRPSEVYGFEQPSAPAGCSMGPSGDRSAGMRWACVAGLALAFAAWARKGRAI